MPKANQTIDDEREERLRVVERIIGSDEEHVIVRVGDVRFLLRLLDEARDRLDARL